jgi:hypothetical protein
MSIATQSSTFVSAVREFAQVSAVGAVGAAAAPRRSAQEPREGGRRHDLVDAMNQVLSIDGAQEPSGEQAVFRFAHALMNDLRTMESAHERKGQATGAAQENGHGPAWGRRQWNDMPQRLDALATAAAASAARAAAVPSEAPVLNTPSAPAVVAAPVVSAAVPEPEVPPQPNPLTTTSAALHLMRVPTSHLLEAYAALHKALGEETKAPAKESPRADLAVFLQSLSKELAADAATELPAGSVLNRTA